MELGLVSIVVPTYERPDLLQKTLQSLVDQTYRPIEILVIDDGSTTDLNKQYCEAFKEVKYSKIENSGGPARPRNVGIKKASGEYIAFVDDDDLWTVDKLKRQVQVFEDRQDVGLIHSYCEVVTASGDLTKETIGRPRDPETKSGDVSDGMMGNWTIMTSTVIMRAVVTEKVGFFNERMPPIGEDMEYWCRCSFFTRFWYVDEPLVNYRQHESISDKWRMARNDVPLYLMEALLELYDDGKVSASIFKNVRNSLVRMQLKRLKPELDKNLWRVFKWNKFWFFNFGNLRLFFKQL